MINIAQPEWMETNEQTSERTNEEDRIATMDSVSKKAAKDKDKHRPTKRKCLFSDSRIVWLIISYYMMFDSMKLAHCLHV